MSSGAVPSHPDPNEELAGELECWFVVGNVEGAARELVKRGWRRIPELDQYNPPDGEKNSGKARST